jgi:hypothetical protein
MNTIRKTSITVGVLFLIALVMHPIGTAIYQPILSAPDYLVNAYPNKTQVLIGILLVFICVPAIVLIPIMLFPILKQHNVSIALGYVGFRILEGVLFIVFGIGALSQLTLSQEYVKTVAPNAFYFQTLGNLIQAGIDWTSLIYIIIFTLGALMFYYLLYLSKLIPRFISVWGFIAAALLLTGTLLSMFELIPLLKVQIFFAPPIALNELILSLWLIVKGFNSSAIDDKFTKIDKS